MSPDDLQRKQAMEAQWERPGVMNWRRPQQWSTWTVVAGRAHHTRGHVLYGTPEAMEYFGDQEVDPNCPQEID